MKSAAQRQTQPPSIGMTRADFETLYRMVGDLAATGPAGLLQQELDRAEVFEDDELPKGTVTLNRWVHFTDGTGNDVRRIQLVLPRRADIDAGKVSILSFVGAGLIGLREGETIDWPAPSGQTRRQLSVIRVKALDPIDVSGQ